MSILRRHYRTIATNQLATIANGRIVGFDPNPSFTRLDGMNTVTTQLPLEYYLGVLGKEDIFPPRTVRTDDPIAGAHYIANQASYATSQDWLAAREVHGIGARPVGGIGLECYFTINYRLQPAGLRPPDRAWILSPWYGVGTRNPDGTGSNVWVKEEVCVFANAEMGEILQVASEDNLDGDYTDVSVVGTVLMYTDPDPQLGIVDGGQLFVGAELVGPDYSLFFQQNNAQHAFGGLTVAGYPSPRTFIDGKSVIQIAPGSEPFIRAERLDTRLTSGIEEGDYFLDFDPTEVFDG